jgi:hypothetical protein
MSMVLSNGIIYSSKLQPGVSILSLTGLWVVSHGIAGGGI